MSVHLAKRVACDRCREHKVRCSRQAQSRDPCTRCARAGASCLVSSAKPLGRPRTVFSGQTQIEKDSGTKNDSLNTSISVAIDHNQTVPCHQPLWPTSEHSPNEFARSHNQDLFNDDILSWSPLAHDDLSFVTQQISHYPLTNQMLSGTQAQGDTPTPSSHYFNCANPAWAEAGSQRNTEAPLGHDQDSANRDSENTVLWLARLSGEMNHHISAIDDLSLDAESMRKACMEKIRQSTFTSPLVPMLRSTADFVACVRRLRDARWASNSSHSPPDQTRPVTPLPADPSHSLDTATLLLLLSTYFQHIQLYSAIFNRSYIAMRDMIPQYTLDLCKALPGLQIGEFPIEQIQLRYKIVIQTIAHQLEQIERYMGFPATYRMSGEREDAEHDEYRGIFDDDPAASALLDAAMKHFQDSERDISRSRIAALKEKMDGTQKLLSRLNC
jgi:hypothetical protein